METLEMTVGYSTFVMYRHGGGEDACRLCLEQVNSVLLILVTESSCLSVYLSTTPAFPSHPILCKRYESLGIPETCHS